MILEKYLNTLEYPKILAKLAEYARFSASQDLALHLSYLPIAIIVYFIIILPYEECKHFC